MIRLLHISDLHYHVPQDGEKNHHHFNSPEEGTLVSAIIDANIGDIDGLIITGDITWNASEKEFVFATEEIGKLIGYFELGKKVLLIPGNHDADWNLAEKERFKEFKKFFKNITTEHVGQAQVQTISIKTQSDSVLIVGANSAAIESKEDRGIGMVGKHPMDTVINCFKREENAVKIFCLHHHLLPVAYRDRDYFEQKNGKQQRRTSVTLDAKYVLSELANARISIILHGHQHQPSIASYYSYDPLKSAQIDWKENPPIWLLGAGSSGVVSDDTGDAKTRHFQIIEIDGTQCTVKAFAQKTQPEGAFEEKAARTIYLYPTPAESGKEKASDTGGDHAESGKDKASDAGGDHALSDHCKIEHALRCLDDIFAKKCNKDNIRNFDSAWSFCFIEEDQDMIIDQLANTFRSQRKNAEPIEFIIPPGYLYLGVGPEQSWHHAAMDNQYRFARHAADTFSDRWEETISTAQNKGLTIEKNITKRYHLASLGVGSGNKDVTILTNAAIPENKDFHFSNESYYFPIDMSPEMLITGTKHVLNHSRMMRRKVIPIQIDFSTTSNIDKIRSITNTVVANDPVIYACLGNALANFESDVHQLKLLKNLIREQDFLLLEVAWTETVDQDSITKAENEYNSDLFISFAKSGLTSISDLKIRRNQISSTADSYSSGQDNTHKAIIIKTTYRVSTNFRTKPVKLCTGEGFMLLAGDSILLSISRKYTDDSLDHLAQSSGFEIISRSTKSYPLGRTNFGATLLLLKATPD